MRTISLHNIRYEPQENGGRLWAKRDGRRVVVGSVFRIGEPARWQAWLMGRMVGAMETEELAREVLETLYQLDERAEKLWNPRLNRFDIIMAKIWQILRKHSAIG